MLFYLAPAIQTRMLVTFDESLNPLPVTVRVGQVSSAHSLFPPKHSHNFSCCMANFQFFSSACLLISMAVFIVLYA